MGKFAPSLLTVLFGGGGIVKADAIEKGSGIGKGENGKKQIQLLIFPASQARKQKDDAKTKTDTSYDTNGDCVVSQSAPLVELRCRNYSREKRSG